MPPQSNATVTGVVGQGQPDDWDTPAVAGGGKWAGSARAYYRETTDRVLGDGVATVVLRRELVLDTATVDAMALDTDDVVTFLVDGEDAPRTATARVIPRKRLVGVPGYLQTSRITLADAEA